MHRRVGSFFGILLVAGSLLPPHEAASTTPQGQNSSQLERGLATSGDQKLPVLLRLNQADWTGLTAAAGAPSRQEDRFPSIYGLTGSGVGIAVLDSGVNPHHLDLADRVVAWKDLVNGESKPYDDWGHGTHVAGIALGSGVADGRYMGVAPAANLIAVKVLDQAGFAPSTRVIEGIQWVLDNRQKYNIRVLNISLSTSTTSDGNDALSLMANKAVEDGIVVVASAGNEGPGSATIPAPAAAAKVITVGAMADLNHNGLSLIPSSGRGPTLDGRIKPDILAPGYEIIAPSSHDEKGYEIKSGTSMAAPFVAGVAALMLEANPSLTPDQVKRIIMATAEDWGAPGPDNEYGAGRLNSHAAVEAAERLVGKKVDASPVAAPTHLSWIGTLSTMGDRLTYPLTIRSSTYNLVLTLIIPAWIGVRNPNFSIELYDPLGRRVATTVDDARQEVLIQTSPTPGAYHVSVISSAGGGLFYLDASGDISREPSIAPAPLVTRPNGTDGERGLL